jgi:hypothetical protein
MSDQHPALPRRIEIPGDTLILDQEWCDQLGGVTRRTSQRLDKYGCPHIYIGGHKYRPLRECQAWLAGRIQRRNQKSPRRNVAA